MNRLVVLLVGVAALAAGAFFYAGQSAQQDEQFPKADSGTEKVPKSIGSGAPIPQQQSPDIQITEPKVGDTVSKGTTVSGVAKVPHGTLYYRLKGQQSGQLVAGVQELGGDGSAPVPFSFKLDYDQATAAGDTAALELYGTPLPGGMAARTIIELKLK